MGVLQTLSGRQFQGVDKEVLKLARALRVLSGAQGLLYGAFWESLKVFKEQKRRIVGLIRPTIRSNFTRVLGIKILLEEIGRGGDDYDKHIVKDILEFGEDGRGVKRRRLT